MSRNIRIVAACSAVLLASCQKAEIVQLESPFTAKAAIEAVETRVGYEFDDNGTTIFQNWVEGDEVFGFDDLGNSFTFSVASVAEDGYAVFDVGGYVPGAASKLFAIYYPGKSVDDFSDGTLSVDLTSQNGFLADGAPVLMSATGTIEGSAVVFTFRNQASVISLRKFQLGAGESVRSLVIDGVCATGEYRVVGGEMVLVPSFKTSSVTATFPAEGLPSDSEGMVETSVYFAALSTDDANISIEALTVSGKKYENVLDIPSVDIVPGRYYYMSKRMFGRARIGSRLYATVSEALAAAASSSTVETVQLIADNTGDASYDGGGDILDLNGWTLEGKLTVGGDLEICDNGPSAGPGSNSGPGRGRLVSSGNTVLVGPGGHVTISGGLVESTATEGEYACSTIRLEGDSSSQAMADIVGGEIIGSSRYGALSSRWGTAVIKGDAILTAPAAARLQSHTNLTIEGGTLTGTEYECIQPGTYNSINITISGGILSAKNSFFVYGGGDVMQDGKITITGGKFKWGSSYPFLSADTRKYYPYRIVGGYYSRNLNYEPDVLCLPVSGVSGYTHRAYPYSLTKPDGSVTGWSNINNALVEAKKAAGSYAIKMYDDYSISPSVTLNGAFDITLDLNGHDFTASGSSRINITSPEAQLHVKNTSGKKSVYRQISTADYYLMKIDAGSVTAENVDFTSAASTCAIYCTGGSFTMDSGSVSAVRSAAYVYTTDIPEGGTGGSVTINGGTLTSQEDDTVHITNADNDGNAGPVPASLLITGGMLVCNSDGHHVVCAKGLVNHRVVVNGDSSIPCFWTANPDDAAIFYRSSQNTVAEISAGYLNRPYAGNAQNTWLPSGYKVETLPAVVTKDDLEFGYQVVPDTL